jgi:hypothetical protein
VSEEPATQVARLRYLLAAGVKENLVDRVAEWPGVHSVSALVEGKPLTGTWYSRTKEYAARQRRREKDVDPADYATDHEIVLEPLPCWEHLPEATWRGFVADLVAEIDEAAARERQRTGKKSMGVRKILRVRPTRRPSKVEKSPKPRFHAIRDRVRRRWRELYREVIQAYRLASLRLREGDLGVEFPEGTFPPALTFVPFTENLILRSRGQPA